MSYASASDVVSLCSNILSGASSFSASTVPSSCQVNTWLSSGCSVIETHLSSWNYVVPAAQDSEAWYMLADLNNLFATARVHLARTVATVGPGERTSGQVFNDMFWKGLQELKNMDLTMAGLERRGESKIYVGGTKISEKAVQEQDTDRAKPRFLHNEFQFPGTVYPNNTSLSTPSDGLSAS
jgi:hypothetical protein